MHPLMTYAIKILRKHSKKWVNFFDNEVTSSLESPETFKKSYQRFALNQLERLGLDLIQGDPEGHFIIERPSVYVHNAYPQAERFWLISGVSGEENFLSGLNDFGLSICFVEKDTVKFSIFFDLLSDLVYYASAGYGAQINERRLRINSQSRSEVISTDCGLLVEYLMNQKYQPRISGCLDLEMMRIIEGKIAFGIYRKVELSAAQRLFLKESLCGCFELEWKEKKYLVLTSTAMLPKVRALLSQ